MPDSQTQTLPGPSQTGQGHGCPELAPGEVVSITAPEGGQEYWTLSLRTSPTLQKCHTRPGSARPSPPCDLDLRLNTTSTERLSSDARPDARAPPSHPLGCLACLCRGPQTLDSRPSCVCPFPAEWPWAHAWPLLVPVSSSFKWGCAAQPGLLSPGGPESTHENRAERRSRMAECGSKVA